MNRNLINTLANIYYERLPKWLLKIIDPFVEPAYSIIHRTYSIVSDILPSVSLFKVNGNANSPDLTLLIAGKGTTFQFLLDRIYNSEPKAIREGKRLIWRIPFLEKFQVNAILIEADRCFSRFLSQRGFVAIPEWVLFTMDVSRPAEEILERWKKRERENIRKVRKHHYVYEAVCDHEKLHFFYYKMFLPYIRPRFGKLAFLVSFGYMENFMQRGGELLLVKKGDEYVSGILISTATSIPMVAFMGVKDGRKDYVVKGAISALYYYTIIWAKERGYTKLDFGHCRPILNDGLFLYKKKLGMRIHRSPRKHRTLYISIDRLKPYHPYLEQFLINNPLIYEDKGQLKGLLFVQGNDQFIRQEVENIKRKYSIPGLKGFTVVPLDSSIIETFK